jgi:hypothetical protein
MKATMVADMRRYPILLSKKGPLVLPARTVMKPLTESDK